jgi:2-oxoglutarate ferredoxin oxidoreductase subunit beta
MTETFSARRYLRDLQMPFCAGCGIFTITNTFLKAVHELGHEDLTGFVFCSGIGCSAWIPSPHFIADSLHTLHGRSIPVAMGIKLLRPELNVVVFGGDGDIVGIGLSHFVHAARRNLDILVIMNNNMIYGMTGGQVAPTTPVEAKTSTTPYGSFEHSLDATKLAVAVGASYVARWTTTHPNELKESIKKALAMQGFRFIEIVSQCPTAFGRRVGLKDAGEMLKWLKEKTVSIEQAKSLDEESLTGRIIVGEFIQRQRTTLVETVHRKTEEAQKEVEED